ncbi:MAG: lysine--tRNA ligase [Candidatus Aenigmatarchaeota archaeon]
MSEETKDKEKEKLKNLQKLSERGMNPYDSYRYDRTHTCQEIVDEFEKLQGSRAKVCGRIVAIREHGKIIFMDIKDRSGTLQVVLRKDEVGEGFENLSLLGRGDFLGVEGEVDKTSHGEKSVMAESFKILSKALRDIPPRGQKLENPEKRYRQRYLDLISNEETKEVFRKRHETTKAMKEFLHKKEFIEVETPILQEIYGGALARPFKTYHNTLDREFYLRISDELYLKRLIVGDYEKVYEIVKDFRNEGIDTTHNPEFTQMECYWAFADYKDMMGLTEEMISYIAKEVLGTTKLEYNGKEIDLSTPWERITMLEGLKEYAGIDADGMTRKELAIKAENNGLEVDKNDFWGDLVALLFEELVEEELVQPTFVYDYPVEISPLAKRKRGDDRLTERFEIFIAGDEFGNAYSELNNPIEQKKRFEEQMKLREEGDMEAHGMDKDYIRALEYGMPPTAGLGIGIDRLVMLFTDKQSIKEVIAFPQMAEEEGEIELRSDKVDGENF